MTTWVNHRFAEKNPGGTDFLVHWVGTRAFIYEGESPYSDSTALKIQSMVYGRQAYEGEHELRVVYPLYSELIFSPFALIENFTLARAVWMTFLEICIILITIISFRLTRLQPGFLMLLCYFLFSLLWYHGLRPLINGNAVVIVTLLVLSALLAIREERDLVAGLLLALSTIKPHLVVLILLFVVIWAATKRRWILIGWIIGGVVLLAILGMLFIPDWILQNLWEIIRFPDYNPTLTLGNAFETWWPGVGKQMKWGLTILLIIIIVLEWWNARGKGFTHFLWTACLTLTISQWIGISGDPGNYVLLFLPLILIFSIINERWRKGGDWIIFFIILFLFLGIWILFLSTVQYDSQPQQNAVMFIPVPLISLIGLYWIRWWFTRPTRRVSFSNPK